MSVLVSACLIGIRCRYDGSHNLDQHIIAILHETAFIPICPEQLGGLSTPRDASNIIGGDGQDVLKGNAKVMSISGKDVTHSFVKGAEEAYRLASLAGAKKAILKKRSPSCGLATPYCQTPSGYGLGVTAAFFINHGIVIIEAG